MNRTNEITKAVEQYQSGCLQSLTKLARISQLPGGRYRVLSQKGKNLGTYRSRGSAENRLRQVEFFKHLDKSDADDSREVIDLKDIDDFSYSAIMRKLRQRASPEQVREFQKIYKLYFDKSFKNKISSPAKVALQNAVIRFSKMYKLTLDRDIIKNAAVTELGDPRVVGKYLANIIGFTLNRISPEKRSKSIHSVKRKIYYLNENDLAMKDMPASSAMGQSITFVKHILFNHTPTYIRSVLNNIVRNLH